MLSLSGKAPLVPPQLCFLVIEGIEDKILIVIEREVLSLEMVAQLQDLLKYLMKI